MRSNARCIITRTAWSRQGKDALLFVDGECWQMDPRSAHVLSSYEVVLDDDRNLVSLERRGRYRRSQVEEER